MKMNDTRGRATITVSRDTKDALERHRDGRTWDTYLQHLADQGPTVQLDATEHTKIARAVVEHLEREHR